MFPDHRTDCRDDRMGRIAVIYATGMTKNTKKVAEYIARNTGADIFNLKEITQITQGLDEISSVVQTNSATAEESAAASEELTGQATLLKNLTRRFRLANQPMEEPERVPDRTYDSPADSYEKY